MKKFIERETGRVTKMSNRFEIKIYSNEDGDEVYIIEGSPSDIRKMMKFAEAGGLTPWNAYNPVMREGRVYALGIEDQEYYHFYRVA